MEQQILYVTTNKNKCKNFMEKIMKPRRHENSIFCLHPVQIHLANCVKIYTMAMFSPIMKLRSWKGYDESMEDPHGKRCLWSRRVEQLTILKPSSKTPA
jgi:hypothetical protein